MFAIWWDDTLGPLVGRASPDGFALTGDEALAVFLGHGVNQEARIGYTNLGRGLVVSLMEAPNCIGVLLDKDEDPQVVERNLVRVAKDIDFNSEDWDTEIQAAFDGLRRLMRSSTYDELLARPEVRRMIDDLVEGRLDALHPRHILRAASTYPAAANYLGSDHEENERTLRDLAAAGLLVPRTYGRRVQCRQCGSSELEVSLTCPSCDSKNLYKVYAVYCSHCGNRTQALIPDDLTEVCCQYCKTPMRVSDLAVLDVEILCQECGRASPDPRIALTCTVCGRRLGNVDILGGTGLSYTSKIDSRKKH
jgi:hypothetical protein